MSVFLSKVNCEILYPVRHTLLVTLNLQITKLKPYQICLWKQLDTNGCQNITKGKQIYSIFLETFSELHSLLPRPRQSSLSFPPVALPELMPARNFWVGHSPLLFVFPQRLESVANIWIYNYFIDIPLKNVRISCRKLLFRYTECFTTLGHNCRRWFPRFLWSKKFI